MSDNFGTWQSLGGLTPTLNTWLRIMSPSSPGSNVFRITFNCADFLKINSWGRLRFVYASNGQEIVQQPYLNIYPIPNPIIIEANLADRLLPTSLFIEIEKRQRWRRFVGHIPDITWSVSVEEFLNA